MKRFSGFISVVLMLFLTTNVVEAQNKTVLDTGTIKQQVDYLIEESNSYNEYKVIRMTNMNKFRRNLRDSIDAAKNEIREDKLIIAEKNHTIDTIQAQLTYTQAELEEAIETKNNLTFLGMEMDKTYYNSLVWTIVLILAVLLTVGTVLFKRRNASTVKTKKELDETKKEFDEYRNKTRITKEQMVVKHHDEVKKLKEQLMKQKSGTKYQ